MNKLEFESMALCPLDGRYSAIQAALGPYFSEYALVRYRVHVEIQWLKFLIENIEHPILTKAKEIVLKDIRKMSANKSEVDDE